MGDWGKIIRGNARWYTLVDNLLSQATKYNTDAIMFNLIRAQGRLIGRSSPLLMTHMQLCTRAVRYMYVILSLQKKNENF